jgi:hypothetical protein
LIPIWRRERKRFPYDLAPDMRAEQFLEWTEEHENEIVRELADQFEVSDDDWAAREAAHYGAA